MHQISVPKGSRVVFLRHAISEWNEDIIKALAKGEKKPTRLPGKRNSSLSAMGQLQAYFAGLYLSGFISQHSFKRKGIVAHSLHLRAKQTAFTIMQSGGLRTTRQLQSDLLAERMHSRYSFVQTPAQEIEVDESHMREFGSTGRVIDTDVSNMRELIRYQPGLAEMLMSDRDAHALAEHLLISYRDTLDYYYKQVKKNGSVINPKLEAELRQSAAARALSDLGSRLAPELSEWFFKQQNLDPAQRRKTPTGESHLDLLHRAKEFYRDLRGMLQIVGNGAVAIVVTHSYFLMAIRQLTEGFSDEKLTRMHNSEGPPFPPHVGMVFYKEKDGYLALDEAFNDLPPGQEPYVIPPEFELYGRRLRFKETVPQERIDQACDVLGIREISSAKIRHQAQASNNRDRDSDDRFHFDGYCNDRKAPGLSSTKPPGADSKKKAS